MNMTIDIHAHIGKNVCTVQYFCYEYNDNRHTCPQEALGKNVCTVQYFCYEYNDNRHTCPKEALGKNVCTELLRPNPNAFIVVRLYKLIFMLIQQLYDVSVEKHPSKFTHFPESFTRPKPSSLD